MQPSENTEIITKHLGPQDVNNLANFWDHIYPISVLKQYCHDTIPSDPGTYTYGVYYKGQLASVMTATFCEVFPCKDSPHGRICHISGAHTLSTYRHKGFASLLLQLIEHDARMYFHADYLCCDSIADALYTKAGFIPTVNETRLWKPLND